MKKIVSTLMVVLALGACSTVELDQPILGSPGNQGNQGGTGNSDSDTPEPQIQQGEIAAADDSIANRMIAGETERLWSAAQFTLAGSSSFTACRLDDQMTFNANGTYRYDGGRLCNAEDNQVIRTGTWRLNFEGQEMIFDEGTSDEYVAEVLALDSNELSLRGLYLSFEVRGRYTAN